MIDRPRISVLRAGLLCRCPRCGAAPLFRGLLDLRPACSFCGLDYAGVDTGDGPAVFVIFILGAVVVVAALVVEQKFRPPQWVHMLLWPPVILLGALALLRPFKGLLIALQYKYRAGSAGEL